MRLHCLSDLHLERETAETFDQSACFKLPGVEADLLVLAGDIGMGLEGVDAAREWADRYRYGAVYVAGNHEYWSQSWPSHLDDMRAAAQSSNVHILENEALVVGGVRFLGCTLWTDFKLYGDATEAHARLVARKGMHDYDLIQHDSGRLLKPLDTQAAHFDSVAWLKMQLRAGFDGPTVVVTHHLPSHRTLNPRWAQRDNDLSNAAYASNLEYLMGPGIDLWLSGHSHHSTQYEINGTRVVSNCRGYPGEKLSGENEGFDPGLVLEI